MSKLTTAGLPERLRILVTVSRNWPNDPITREMFRKALLDEFESVAGVAGFPETPDEITVVHGAQGVYDRATGRLLSGGDMIADEVAKELGMCTNPIPADWNGPCDDTCHHGPRRKRGGRSYCQMAGFRRNQALVATVPDVGLAFPHPAHPSLGTRDCIRRMAAAGVIVYNIPDLLKQGVVVR